MKRRSSDGEMECDDVGAGRRSHRVEGGEVDCLHEQWITRSDQKQTLRSIGKFSLHRPL